jgi:hypothetical protein
MRSMQRPIMALIIVTAASFAAAQAEPQRRSVQDFRELLVDAIDSSSGQAYGQLTGELADALSRATRAAGPILIDVRTERRYAQEGCSRLTVTFRQEGVHLPGTDEPQRKVVEMGINYCRDGAPPKSLL